MKIYLVGFMGSGKTTVGRELAARIEAFRPDVVALRERIMVQRFAFQDLLATVSEHAVASNAPPPAPPAPLASGAAPTR